MYAGALCAVGLLCPECRECESRKGAKLQGAGHSSLQYLCMYIQGSSDLELHYTSSWEGSRQLSAQLVSCVLQAGPVGQQQDATTRSLSLCDDMRRHKQCYWLHDTVAERARASSRSRANHACWPARRTNLLQNAFACACIDGADAKPKADRPTQTPLAVQGVEWQSKHHLCL